MSVPSQITRIKAAKTAIITALTEKGVTVPSTAKLDDMAGYIRSIEGVNILSAYPVGSIYMSISSTSPATLFGGTWERIKDKFLLSAGDTYTAGATGGEATHTLTASEMPKHVHKFYGDGEKFTIQGDTSIAKSGTTYANSPGINLGATWSSEGQITLGTAGEDAAHNNMPPYLTVYMWKRTA